MIGDATAGRWKEAWLIQHRENFHSWAHPVLVTWQSKVLLMWWLQDARFDEASGKNVGEISFVEWGPKGFGRKTRVFLSRNAPVSSADMAIDQDTGQIVYVFSTSEGVYAASRLRDGRWTKHSLIEPSYRVALSVESIGRARFVIRAGEEDTKQFLLQPKR